MRKPRDRAMILVVDDSPEDVCVILAALASEFFIVTANSGSDALKLAESHAPDLILLDVAMPSMDGYEVCMRLKANPITCGIPVVFVTGMVNIDDEERGFAVGGCDYIIKPFRQRLIMARVRSQLEIKAYRDNFEQLVDDRTRQLADSYREAVFMLGEAGHYNDTDTGVHIWRMAAYSRALAVAAGWTPEMAARLELAAPMHDTGKVGIPHTILKAPRKLTDEEWEVMKQHSDIGFCILNKSSCDIFKMSSEVALYHHEKWDGSGYPKGLSGADIPEAARIVALADVFDALTMKRPYKEPWPIEDCVAEIVKSSGSHFEPRLVEVFLGIIPELLRVKDGWDRRCSPE